jgi:plasmid stabilization system protein ParE
VASNIRVLLEPTAQTELQEAIEWYEERQAGLGTELAIEVDRCIERIRAHPEMYGRVRKNYRRALVQRFPYAVFYELVADTVIVFSIFHGSRNPAKLKRRLP